MVNLSLWTLLAVFIECAEPVGVVRVARGEVFGPRLLEAKLPLVAGALLCTSSTVAVGTGWAELFVGQHGRVRLSSRTELQTFNIDRIRLVRGRVWVELGARASPAQLVINERTVVIQPGTSAVVERTRGGIITVIRGKVDTGAGRHIEAGCTGFVDGSELPRRGGDELYALVRREARAGLGDIAGWKAFLLGRIQELEIGIRPRLMDETTVKPRSIPPAGGVTDRMVEEALRPAPIRMNDDE